MKRYRLERGEARVRRRARAELYELKEQDESRMLWPRPRPEPWEEAYWRELRANATALPEPIGAAFLAKMDGTVQELAEQLGLTRSRVYQLAAMGGRGLCARCPSLRQQ